MRTYEELERLRQNASLGPARRGTVRRICLRLGGGRHQHAESVEVTPERGVVGDRWSSKDDPERLCQVTLINASVGEWIAHGDTRPLEAGDNFHVDLDLSEDALPTFSQLRLGGALLEVTAEPHLGCKKFRERFGAGALRWVNHSDLRVQRLRGVNLRVLAAGLVRVGDAALVLGAAEPTGHR